MVPSGRDSLKSARRFTGPRKAAIFADVKIEKA
jgi:hypothetical protein